MKLHLSNAPHIHSRVSTTSIMLNVIISLMPCAIAGIWYFGVNAALLLLISSASAVATEYILQKITHQTVRIGDLSALVTGLILGLNLPPTAPWWIAVIGSFIAIALCKQLFGGIGDNFVNPALAARAILLASWAGRMSSFVNPTCWTGVDAVSSATPLATGNANLMDMFIGNIPGTIGEVSKLMIVIGFIYLLISGTISWRIPICMIGSTFIMTWILGGDPLYGILAGGLMFGAVYMATDYTTSPMTAIGQIIYAIGAGIIVAIIREFGAYAGGVTYGILIMNILTPIIDKLIRPRTYGHAKGADVNG